MKELVEIVVDRILDCDQKLKTQQYETYDSFMSDFKAVFDFRLVLTDPDQ